MDWSELRATADTLAQHVTLADIYERIGRNPREALDDELKPARAVRELDRHALDRQNIKVNDFQFCAEIVSFWLLTNICDRCEPVICSPSGNLLNAPEPIFFHPDQFFYFYLRFPLRDMAELRTIFEEFDARRMRGSDLWDRFSCIDAERGLVKHKVQSERNLAEFYEDGAVQAGGKSAVFEQHVRPFLGWSIVIPPSTLPDTIGELLKDLCVGEAYWYDGGQTTPQASTKRRGPKPGPAKQEFLRRYPDGIPDGLTAEAVAAELTEAGFPIGRRQVSNYDKEARSRK